MRRVFPSGRRWAACVLVLGSALVLLAGVIHDLAGVARGAGASARLVQRGYEAIGAADGLLSTVQDAEIGQRGYLLTGDPVHLASYDRATARVRPQLQGLEHLAADDPAQAARLPAIRGLVDHRLAELARAIALRRGGDEAGARAVVRSGEDKRSMDELREAVGAFTAEERRLATERVAEFAAAQRQAAIRAITMVIVLLSGAAAVLLFAYRSRRTGIPLSAREAEIGAIYASAPVGLAYHDRGLRFRAVNDWLAAIDGRPVAAHIGRTIREIAPEVADKIEPIHRQVLETGEPVLDRDIRIATPATGGVPRDYIASFWPMKDADGHVVGVAMSMVDVTERKAGETQLEEAKERLASLLEGTDEGLWDWNVVTGEVRRSARWQTMLGYAPGEIEPSVHAWEQLVHPDDRAEMMRALRDHLDGRTDHYEAEHRIRTKDGHWLWILDRGKVIARDGEGRPLRVVGTQRDVSTRKAAEQRVRASEEWLQLAQKAGGVTTWEWNIATGEATTWSERKSSLPPDRLGPSYGTFLQTVHPDDRGLIQDRAQAALRNEQPFDIEFRIVRPDRTIGWLAARGDVLRDAGGEPVRMIGVSYDVTERHEATAALTRLNVDLEQRVQHAAKQMMQLQKMESLGRLTGGIAHDFNNLLMAVLSSLDLLKKRLPADDLRTMRLIDNAIKGAERGVTLTRRMLAFARKQDLKPEPVAVPDLVTGMTELLRRSLGPQMIRIETRFAPDLPKALVDANQLELAILNLAVNARDAMPDGGVLIIEVDAQRIGEDSSLPPGSYVRLRLTDTGIGMDRETLERAMEPFFTTKGVGKGTGLGLSMVDGLAAQSGGRFTLASEPGRGTTAEILLPVAPPQPRAEPSAPPIEAEAGPEPRALSVLVVDDDQLILMGTTELVADLGHTAIEAGSAQEALDILRSGRTVDVVLTDQAMPGMTGLQLAVAIEAEWPGLPVILATGFAEMPDTMTRSVVALLKKPVRQNVLAAALVRAARSEPAARGGGPFAGS
ncbi:PAS domain-containing protein [Benzoatithermus flavus]|uniref:histidine kinase n=1 Tax=Benzoatithermus flavus TaxID=3108223 RepID=A0ABU8XWD4_9PROT